MAIQGYCTDGSPPESGHVGNFSERVMSCAGDVDGWGGGQFSKAAFGIVRESPRQSYDDRRKIRLGPSACEVRAGVFRQTKLRSQPTERVSFNLIRRRRGPPCGQLWVIHGDQRVGNNRRHRHAGVKQTKISRMSHLYLPGVEHSLKIGDQFIEGYRFLEVITGCEVAPDFFRRDTRDNGAIRDVGLKFRNGAL